MPQVGKDVMHFRPPEEQNSHKVGGEQESGLGVALQTEFHAVRWQAIGLERVSLVHCWSCVVWSPQNSTPFRQAMPDGCPASSVDACQVQSCA